MPKNKNRLVGTASTRSKKIKKLDNLKKENKPSASIGARKNPNCDPPVDNSLFGGKPQSPKKFTKKTVEYSAIVHTFLTSDEEDFLGFTPEKNTTSERNLVGIESSFISGNDTSMIPISSHCNSVEFNDSDVQVDEQCTGNDSELSVEDKRQSFFKIVLGDFCQFSTRFPYPNNQCTAMAATALAYNTIKPVSQWNKNDLNIILIAGQTYYEECLTNLNLTNRTNTDYDLEAINLNKNLSINSENFEVIVDLEECKGGAYESEDTILKAFEQVELKCLANCILTYKGYSYAILRCSNSLSNSYFYVFFDSHGRKENGEKVIPDTGNEGKSAILFFESAKKFIDFFVKEWPILSQSEVMNFESQYFILVPLYLRTSNFEMHRLSDHIQIGCEDIGRESDINFYIVCGDINEYNIKPAPHYQHQCSGIVVFSFLYSTLHSIMEWNAENLKDILLFGNQFYQRRYEQQDAQNSQYDATSTMHPLQLGGHCSYANFLYKIHVNELEFSGRMNKEHILNGFEHLQNLEAPYGILIVNGLSYGITICRFDHSFSYVFFDSHGRTNTGASGGPHSAVLYFDDVNIIATFIFNQFREANGFDLHPVKFSRQPIPSDVNYDPFTKIVASIKSIKNVKEYTLDVALSMCAIFYAFQNGAENWQASDLNEIFCIGEIYNSHCNETYNSIDGIKAHANLNQFIRDIYVDEDKYSMFFHSIADGKLLNLKETLRIFYNSDNYKYAMLTVRGLTYAIFKCSQSLKIIFYDVHGRNVDGTNGGTLSVAIYFNTYQQFYAFLVKEKEDMSIFSLHCVKIVQTAITVQQNLLPRVISGSYAQNDSRFSVSSRNTQCTANSVVFLAFASVIKAQWISDDVDAILTLGDHIYTSSYREAIIVKPRTTTFLAAHEILQNIFVNISRFHVGVVHVNCKPLTDKEYSGNFEKFAKILITRFFENYNNGVFVCCSLSVALHKYNNEYIIFDPHARTLEGKMHFNGTANIFFFNDISSLYECLCRFGYNSISEFTLVPFDVNHVGESKNPIRVEYLRANDVMPVSEDSMDDIPMAESPDWFPSDNVPLIQLINRCSPAYDLSSSKSIQLKEDYSQVSMPSSVKSMSVVNLKPKSVIDKNKKRSQRQYDRQKRKFKLSTQEEQSNILRWRAYERKLERTRTLNMFGNFQNFEEFRDSFKTDACNDDDAIIRAADAAVEELTLAEESRQLRLLNNALIPTHCLAAGNHEDIDEDDDIYTLYKLSPFDQVCPHCGALYFKEECNSKKIFRTCCNFGQIHSMLPQQQATTYPQFLRELLTFQSPLSKHFMDNIMQYNNVLSFASLGTTNVHHMQARGSLGPVVAMEGMIYHVAEHFRTNSTGVDMPIAQLYYMNNNAAVSERLNRVTEVTLNRSLLLQLENYMRANNPLAGAYRMLKDVLNEVRRRPNSANTNVHLQIVRNRDQIRIRQNHGGDFGMPTSNEVAIVYTHLPSSDTKNIVVFPVNQTPEEGITIASDDPNRDAMMYPLLFPYSEQTWSSNLKRHNAAEIAQLQAREPNQLDSTFIEEEDKTDDEAKENVKRTKPRVRITVREFFCYILMLRMAFSPLLSAGKLSQQFIIDAYARAQDNTFEYLQSDRGQAQIRSETYGALKDFLDRKKVFQPDIPGKLIVMPNDIIGSRQYMKSRYQDTLAVVAKYGKPTFFVTMTCNPMWEEIQRQIPKGANAVDHPGVVARVFRAKVNEFIHDISKKHVLGKCVAYVAVIEWQKRSLPHCHLVTFNSPEDRPESHLDIDNFVSAEIPDPIKNNRLYQAVTTYMYHHRCDDTTNMQSCRVKRKGMFHCPRHPRFGEEEDKDKTKACICYECSKHFPRKYAEKSELIENSYPIYRRRRNGRSFLSSKNQIIDNRWIVPYNPQLLLKYNCHLNIEITTSLKSIKYLFKYLHKGVDMARLNIKIIDNVQVYNEFEHFVDCRYLSAGEAIWKLYDYPMFYQSHTVYSLPVHLENYQNVIFNPKNPAAALRHADSMLSAYFTLNEVDPEAREYLYAEIPIHYVYDKQRRAWHRRKRRQEKTLGRIYMVNYNNVELYALRLLLLMVKGAQSFEELRTVNGVQYDTFRRAATELGLLQDDSLHIKTFEEIIDVEMPYRIRCLFVNMLLFNTPSDPAAIWERFKGHMYEDYVRKGCHETLAMNLALRHISNLMTAAGKNNTDYLLPEPMIGSHDGQQAQAMSVIDDVDIMNQADSAAEGERMVQMLNYEQRCIFDEICDSAIHPTDLNKKRLFFVDGPGGTGKTFLFSTLINTLNGMGLSVVPIAWTGIAASLLKGGRTVHSTFKLPLDMNGRVAFNLSTLSDSADTMRNASVIVWDEISMSLSYAIDAVDAFFQDLMGNRLPFGGKVFVATGDFRQILPIVKGGSKYELLKVTAKHSVVWPLLEKRQLRTNVRLNDPNDVAFGKWLLDVGEDKIHDFPANQYHSSYVKLPSECVEQNSIVDRIYGATFSSFDVEHYSKYAILSTVHEDVDSLNEEIYKRLTETVSTEKIFYSSDSVIGLDPNDDDAYDVSLLNTLNAPNLPPHALRLKENCIVMLLCNLSPAKGLCNGTRLIVTKLYNTCIRGKILGGDHKGKEVLISRCRINVDSSDVSGKLQRIQLPLKLAFVMTINKAQGQTFDSVGVYFRKSPFAHGQLYVALSRVRSKEKLIIQVLPDGLMGKLRPESDDVFVPNVVYKEVF